MNRPGLADLYRLGEQLERDRETSVQELRRRDHAIGLRCEEADEAGRLLFWLRNLPPAEQGKGATAERLPSEQAVLLALRGLALLSGFIAMASFLLASGRGMVNVFVFLLLFVLVQLVFCCLSAYVLARSMGGSPPAVLPLNPARLVLSRALPDRRYLRECQSVLRLLLLRYGQELGLLFTMGAVAAFFGVLAFSEFTFVWGSTFEVSDGFVHDFSRAVSAPWSTWLPSAVPGPELIAQSRFHPALTDLEGMDRRSLRGWWPFLIMAVACYALLPRLCLWLFSLLGFRRLMRRSLLDYPGAGAALARMQAPVVDTRSHEPAETPGEPRERVALDDGLMLLDWAGALQGGEPGRFDQLRAVPPDNVLPAGLASLQEDAQSAAGIDEYRPERLLVAVKSWEPPMADLADFLLGLGAVTRCTLCLVPLAGRAVTDHSLREWTAFARELPFDSVAAEALDSL